MSDATYQPKIYRKQGGDELHVAAAGILNVEDDAYIKFGDDLDIVATFNGTNLVFTPATDDTGAIHIGDGTTDMDFKVFLGSTSKYVLFDVGNSAVDFHGVDVSLSNGIVIDNPATGVSLPINMNSITAMTGDETTQCGNVIKINRSAGAIGGTHSGAIIKHYITGGAVDGTGLVSGLYVNLKYQPDSENAAAEVSLIETHLYSGDSDAIDYGWYCLAPDSKIGALLGVSGTMASFMEVKASGAGGFTVSSDGMTKNPESDTEDGYLTVNIEGGASYQIPAYAA